MIVGTRFDERKSIWKFPLKIENYQDLELPKGADILCVQVQNNIPCLWAICDVEIATKGTKETRHFRISGTGHPLAFGDEAPKYSFRKYIGTFQLEGGALVFHVFELFND